MTTLSLYDFLSNKIILHSDTAYEYINAMRFFCENEQNADIITYDNTRHFSLLNIGVLEKDIDGHYFYEFSIKRNGDIVDNIHYESASNLKVQLSYYIGEIKYMPEEIKKFVIAASQYHDFIIRITFLEIPTVNLEFKILSRYYLINLLDRVSLSQKRITTQNNVYSNGICCKKNE